MAHKLTGKRKQTGVFTKTFKSTAKVAARRSVKGDGGTTFALAA